MHDTTRCFCRGAFNIDHSSLKQKEKSEPIQANDLAVVSEVGGNYKKPPGATPSAVNLPVLGLPDLWPKGLAKAG